MSTANPSHDAEWEYLVQKLEDAARSATGYADYLNQVRELPDAPPQLAWSVWHRIRRGGSSTSAKEPT